MRLPFIEDARPRHPIDEGTRWYWMLWNDLASERPSGPGGVGPIPITRVLDYLARRGICGDEAEMIQRAIRKADSLYLREVSRRLLH